MEPLKQSSVSDGLGVLCELEVRLLLIFSKVINSKVYACILETANFGIWLLLVGENFQF